MRRDRMSTSGLWLMPVPRYISFYSVASKHPQLLQTVPPVFVQCSEVVDGPAHNDHRLITQVELLTNNTQLVMYNIFTVSTAVEAVGILVQPRSSLNLAGELTNGSVVSIR